jgi:diacylglycerol kinase (ATP)
VDLCGLVNAIVPSVPGIGVITNPRSKANKRNPLKMRQLAYLLGTRGATEATRSIDDLYRAAEEFKAAGIDILGINGGDGTIHVTLTAFLKVYGTDPFPKVAILRGGTLNTIARGLGIHGDTQELLYDVIDKYHQGEELVTVERNILQVGEDFGFIFGNGIIANFLDAYYASGAPSPWMGFKMLMHAVGSAMIRGSFSKRIFKRFAGHVTVDGERWAREDFLTLAASTVPEIGLGFRPFYRYDEKPGHFPLVGFHTTPFGMCTALPTVFRGKAVRRDKCISVVTKDVDIQSEEPWSYTVDGDMHAGVKSLRIRTGPVLHLIVPGRSQPRELPEYTEARS